MRTPICLLVLALALAACDSVGDGPTGPAGRWDTAQDAGAGEAGDFEWDLDAADGELVGTGSVRWPSPWDGRILEEEVALYGTYSADSMAVTMKGGGFAGLVEVDLAGCSADGLRCPASMRGEFGDLAGFAVHRAAE